MSSFLRVAFVLFSALLLVQIGELRKIPKCGPVCAIHCPYGNVLDRYGCPTCQCKQRPGQCPPQICGIACPNGFVKKNGCPICRCRKGYKYKYCRRSCSKYCHNPYKRKPRRCRKCKC